jgi:hypothetical protein
MPNGVFTPPVSITKEKDPVGPDLKLNNVGRTSDTEPHGI